MIRQRLFFSMVSAAILGAGLYFWKSASPAIAAPQIHVARSTIDLGKVALTDDDFLFEYEIQNWGTAPLRIDGTILSCGCTKPELPTSDILPNESAQVRLRIDPEVAGEKRVSVTLLTNDPAHPRFTLRAQWVATNGITVTPPNLDFGTVEHGQSVSKVINVTRLNERVVVETAQGEPNSIQVQLNGDQLTVTVIPTPYPVTGTGAIRLSIQGNKTRPFLIPVTWHVDHPYQAFPESLFLGYAKPGSDVNGVIRVQNRNGINVAVEKWNWKEELAGAICEVTQDEGAQDQFTVDWTAPRETGLHRGILAVQMADHEILIPVSALVASPAN